MFFFVNKVMDWLYANPMVILTIFGVSALIYLISDMRNRKKDIDNRSFNINVELIEDLKRYNQYGDVIPEVFFEKYDNCKIEYFKLKESYKSLFSSDLLVWCFYTLFAICSISVIYSMTEGKALFDNESYLKFERFIQGLGAFPLIIGIIILIGLIVLVILSKRKNKKEAVIKHKSHMFALAIVAFFAVIILGVVITYYFGKIPSDKIGIYLPLGLMGVNLLFMISRNDPIFKLIWMIPTLSLANNVTTTKYDVYEVEDNAVKTYKGETEEITGGAFLMIVGLVLAPIKLFVILLYTLISSFATIALSYLYFVLYIIFMSHHAHKINQIDKMMSINDNEEKAYKSRLNLQFPYEGLRFYMVGDKKYKTLAECRVLDKIETKDKDYVDIKYIIYTVDNETEFYKKDEIYAGVYKDNQLLYIADDELYNKLINDYKEKKK